MAENRFFRIFTLGCKVNSYDSMAISYRLKSLGWQEAKTKSEQSQTDLVLINTCSVTQKALKKDRRLFNWVKNHLPKTKVVVFGCGVKLYRERFKNLGADYLFGVSEADQIIEQIKIDFPLNIIKNKNQLAWISAPKAGERARYFLKIQDGCEQFCAYCIIPYSRGELWSRSITEILQEAQVVVAKGYREIVLCGIHLGLYGKEKNGCCGVRDLAEVVERITQINDLVRLRLSSIEVNDIDERMLEQFKTNPKLCHHLHLSLQSGSNSVLSRMKRPYDKAYFADICQQLRKIDPSFAITTDVIVGFPGETPEDFQETLDFVEEIGFSRLHVFPFSAHEKTTAYHLKPRVEPHLIKNRANKLRAIGVELVEKFENKLKNHQLEVLIEYYFQSKDLYKGKTEYFTDVFFTVDQVLNFESKEIKELKVGTMIKIEI